MGRLVAITRAVGPALTKCEVTFVPREPIDVDKASEQHAAYRAALEDAGVSVSVLTADDNLPDGVFVEDVAVVLDEVAVITRPGALSRRAETVAVAAALAAHRRTVCIEPPGTLEGGDVLRVGRKLFVGRSLRTNDAGFEQLAAIVGPLGYEAVRVDINDCLHLKTAVTALSPDTLFVNPNWVDTGKFGGFRLVAVPAEEPFAANALTLDGLVHISTRSRRTRVLLESHGFRTRSLDLSELEKAEAGLTCMSLIFQAAMARRLDSD